MFPPFFLQADHTPSLPQKEKEAHRAGHCKEREEVSPDTLDGLQQERLLKPHVKCGELGYRNPRSNPPRGFNGTDNVSYNPERPR